MTKQRVTQSLCVSRFTLRSLMLAAILVFATASLFLAPTVVAQSLRIVAVVNDDVISEYDLGNRIGMVMTMSNLPQRTDVARQLAPQVLRTLIDEKLRLQDAAELEIELSGEDIDRALSEYAGRNGTNTGALMETFSRRNIDPDTLIDFLRSEMSWGQNLFRRFGDRLSISDRDIELARVEIEAALGKPEYNVAEIFLAENADTPASEVAQQATRIVQQIRNGASFPGIAQSFSDLPTASNGGQLGWVQPSRLPGEVATVLQTMQPGTVSDPIRVTGGVYIIAMRDRRIAGQQVQGEATVTLSQFHLAVPADTPQDTVQQYMSSAVGRVAGLSACEDFEAVAKSAGSPVSGSLGTLPLDRLPPPIRAAVSSLPIGGISSPIRNSDAIVILMVCDRTEAEVTIAEVDPERIRQSIFGERINSLGRQRLRELRRAAFIDIRQ